MMITDLRDMSSPSLGREISVRSFIARPASRFCNRRDIEARVANRYRSATGD
jgi:hypothetical protein